MAYKTVHDAQPSYTGHEAQLVAGFDRTNNRYRLLPVSAAGSLIVSSAADVLTVASVGSTTLSTTLRYCAAVTDAGPVDVRGRDRISFRNTLFTGGGSGSFRYELMAVTPATLPATSGLLVVGTKYVISSYVTGDDFTNVGAASNATGISFVAIGTTPTAWIKESELSCLGLTSGALVSGATYLITVYNADDDFTNLGAVANSVGTIFKSTGTTPTHWAHASALLRLTNICLLDPRRAENMLGKTMLGTIRRTDAAARIPFTLTSSGYASATIVTNDTHTFMVEVDLAGSVGFILPIASLGVLAGAAATLTISYTVI